MFIPIRSDRPLRVTPYVNYGLIAANVLIFAATHASVEAAHFDPTHPIRDFYLNVQGTVLWQFITCQFLHADAMHLIGNMIFLWVFGNAVEDRLGKVGYLFFYLAMGVFAGLAHWMTSNAPVLGASGAVAGVTGAFLALFPRTRITFIYFFFFIGAFQVPAIVVVMFYFIKDMLFMSMDVGNTAYTAHLGGNIMGFVIGITLLGSRLLPREPYDLLTLWEHKRRRDRFRKIAEEGSVGWQNDKSKVAVEKPLSEEDKRVLAARQEISRAITNHDMDHAARLYQTLTTNHGDQALSQRQQFDLANHLTGMGEHVAAASAYELLLKTYPNHSDKAHAQLMLGVIHARYLNQPDAAKPHLQEASQRLQGDDAALARQVLSEIS